MPMYRVQCTISLKNVFGYLLFLGLKNEISLKVHDFLNFVHFKNCRIYSSRANVANFSNVQSAQCNASFLYRQQTSVGLFFSPGFDPSSFFVVRQYEILAQKYFLNPTVRKYSQIVDSGQVILAKFHNDWVKIVN